MNFLLPEQIAELMDKKLLRLILTKELSNTSRSLLYLLKNSEYKISVNIKYEDSNLSVIESVKVSWYKETLVTFPSYMTNVKAMKAVEISEVLEDKTLPQIVIDHIIFNLDWYSKNYDILSS